MEQFVKFLYAVDGAIVILCYLPQIWALWKDSSGAQSTSIKMWTYWAFSQCISIAYMGLVAKNHFLMTFSIGHLLGCGAIALLAAWRRRTYRGFSRLASG
jgi:hypothetical protein